MFIKTSVYEVLVVLTLKRTVHTTNNARQTL